jgi:protein-tyrosine phosphatase
MKILMVCLGNICRSPLAEGIMKAKISQAGLDWIVDSAGTNGCHIGEPPHRLSQKVAQIHHIDISNLRARQFIIEDLDRFDEIYAMAEEVVIEMRQIAGKRLDGKNVKLLMNELYPGKDIDVPDPWSGPESGYHEVYKMLDAVCSKIIEKYALGEGLDKGQEFRGIANRFDR